MKRKGLFALQLLGFVVFLFACSKVNQPTDLGDELIPTVDNVNTFDTTLALDVVCRPFDDSTRHLINDPMAIGRLNDPVFGVTNSDMYFNLSSTVDRTSPFHHRDSVIGIDSVVLQLAFAGAYGDTTDATRVNIEVAEISKNNGFNDTTAYRYDHPGFLTQGVLGTSSFSVRQLRDSITLIRKGDTSKVANVLRVRLNNTLGERLSKFDTTDNGPYKNDSLFREAFRGLAVKTTGVSGLGSLAYFDIYNTGTSLLVYFRVKKSEGVIDTASAVFQHARYSQAVSIQRTPGGEYVGNLNQASPQQLYIQSSPQGSYASIFVPGLNNFPNRIIHRAELIAFKEPSNLESTFTPPSRMFLDHKSAGDTALLFDNDIQAIGEGQFNLAAFGGNLRSDNSYRFNITRYVQGIVTLKNANDTLRMYAPLRTLLYSRLYQTSLTIPVANVIANGRVVLAGANHPNPARQMRLRIIYSNI